MNFVGRFPFRPSVALALTLVATMFNLVNISFLAAQRMEQLAGRCPPNTIALICVEDLRVLREQLLRTETLAALGQVPKMVDWVEQMRRNVQKVATDPKPEDVLGERQSDWSECLNGPAELVVLKDQNIRWYFHGTFDRNHWLAQRLLAFVRNADESTGDKQKQIIKLKDTGLNMLGESSACLGIIGDWLLMASDEGTFHALCDRLVAPVGSAGATLADQRRFQTASAHLSRMTRGQPQISFYIDLNEITRVIVDRSANPVENQRITLESGLTDLLTLTGAVLIPDAENSCVDWECMAVLNQGLPRTGISKAIALRKLNEPFSDFVPFHVDFACSLQFDPNEFCSNILAVDQLIFDLSGHSEALMNGIGNVAPYLAAICGLQADYRAAIVGEFEQYGWLVESAGHIKWPIVNRLATTDGQADQVLEAMLGAETSLVKMPMNNGLRYQLSLESIAQIEQRLEELRRLNSEPPARLEIPQQVFWSRDNAIWLASDLDGKSIDPEQWMTIAERPLNREPVFRMCWDHVAAAETPILYFHLGDGMMLRPLAHWSLMTTDRWFHQHRLERIAQLEGNHAGDKDHHLRMLKAIDHWDWNNWCRQLGPGAIALYDTSSGIGIRVVQFRCSN